MFAWFDTEEASTCTRQSGLTDGYPFPLAIGLLIPVWTLMYLFFTVVAFMRGGGGTRLGHTCWLTTSLDGAS
jgi:hypothetical protein